MDSTLLWVGGAAVGLLTLFLVVAGIGLLLFALFRPRAKPVTSGE